MVRFLHTADWQLGMKVSLVGEKGKEVRAKRLETLSRVADLVVQQDIDFVLLAGDMFESQDVDDVTVKRAVDILNRLRSVAVFIIPGNHDPLVAGSVWHRQSWKRSEDHIHLVKEAQEVDLDKRVALYPCPLKQKQSNLDPTAWIPPRKRGDSRIRIGLAHGSLDVLPESVNFPIAADRADLSDLDYLALGDWHSFIQHGKAVYSGTIEPTSFSERDAGNVLVVDIEDAGEPPNVQRHRVSSLTWVELESHIRDETDVEKLDTEIHRVAASISTLIARVRIFYDPDVSAETQARLNTLHQELEEDAFFVDWIEPLIPPTGPAVSPLPEGILSLVDGALSTLLDGRIPDGPGQTFAREPRQVIEETRILLHKLARGEGA